MSINCFLCCVIILMVTFALSTLNNSEEIKQFQIGSDADFPCNFRVEGIVVKV